MKLVTNTLFAALALVATACAPVLARGNAPVPSCCVGGNCCASGSCCASTTCCKADKSCCDSIKGVCTSACGCPTMNCCDSGTMKKTATKATAETAKKTVHAVVVAPRTARKTVAPCCSPK